MPWLFIVEVAFWSFLALAVYPILGYPLVAYAMSRMHRAAVHRTAFSPGPISIVVAAFNEARGIQRRIQELSQLARAHHASSEVIVVSDGSTDETAAKVQELALENVRLIALPTNGGKAIALNQGVAAAEHEIIVFADARQTWTDQTLARLLESFADEEVGAVSGDLELRHEDGALAAVGFYWRLEKWLRICESRWRSAIGVTGAISAVRKRLFRPLPPGTILDDVYWPLDVAMQGKRVVHHSNAKAVDRLPAELADEYKRKLRTLSGNFQLLSLRPELLLPWRNPVWFQFVSHKVLRLATPWCLLAAWACSLALAARPLYATLLVLQTAAFLVGLVGASTTLFRGRRLLSIATGVFVLNCAAWMAFWVWISGKVTRSWAKVEYSRP